MSDDIKVTARMMVLLVVCPLLDRDEHCPLKILDELDIRGKYQWLIMQSDIQVRDFLNYHDQCFSKRQTGHKQELLQKHAGK